MTRSKIMGLRLPPALKREFAEIASQKDTTVSALSRGLIETFVKKHRRNNHATVSN
jgi:predicted transcriptional regulator